MLSKHLSKLEFQTLDSLIDRLCFSYSQKLLSLAKFHVMRYIYVKRIIIVASWDRVKLPMTARYKITNGACACNHRWLKLISLADCVRENWDELHGHLDFFFIARRRRAESFYWESRVSEIRGAAFRVLVPLFVQEIIISSRKSITIG